MYILGAALAAIGAVIFAIYSLLAYRLAWSDRLTIVGGTLVGGFIAVITMLAVAELLKLFIDIEHNTRMAAAARPAGAPVAMVTVSDNGGAGVAPATVNRLESLNEETAEAALLRGH
jgi:hypothetical protein